MGKFNDHFSGKQNDEYEYYEDAHGGLFGNDRNAFTGSSDRDTFTGSSDRDSFSRDKYPRATDYRPSDRDSFSRDRDAYAPRNDYADPGEQITRDNSRDSFSSDRNSFRPDREVYPRNDTYAPREQQPAPERVGQVVGSGSNRITEYSPNTPEDVQTVIDSLRRGESAIVKLNGADAQGSQRVLDFLSGAVYALSGSIYRVEGNIFLLSPSGVGVKKS